jgi:ABC-2 type transport system ATP-binding protein
MSGPTEHTEFAILARGLGKAYGARWTLPGIMSGSKPQLALDGLDLSVPRGVAFGLIGLNGAGKTTFVKALLGVILPSTGELRVLGGAPGDVSVHARIGYVPERLALPTAWTALAYLRSVARLKRRGARNGELSESAMERQLVRVGLGSAGARRIGQFSKGMRQRLALAAALLGEPDLLVLDEPTDGVDPIGRAEIRELLREEHARGATLFLNSHLLSETERMCDVIGILSQGKIVRQGSVAELCGAAGAWRARFAAGASPALPALGFEPLADGSYAVTASSAEELDQRLGAARASGALLVELLPRARDLESVLVEVLGP